jgi:hypothetical protein
MTLGEYLDGMRSATTARALEAAIQAPFKHPFSGRIWSRICAVRIESAYRICAAHPQGHFVFRLGPRHRLTVCDREYGVGYGQNSTGVRYCWHYAQKWGESVLREHGFSMRGAHAVWESSFDYPHRALQNVEMALAGKLPDPRFNRLIPWARRDYDRPVRVDREIEARQRAHRSCKCGDGWLWDWGSGWNGYATFINWHCDKCPRVYTEYVDEERLCRIRQSGKGLS